MVRNVNFRRYARQQFGGVESFARGGKFGSRPAPLQLVDVGEELRVGSKRCEFLKQQRKTPALAELLRRKLLDRAITREKSGRAFRPNAWDAGIAIGRVANERKVVRYQFGINPELRADAVCIADHLRPSVHLHDPIPAHALREIFIRSPNADLLDARILRGDGGPRSQRIVGLEFGHRPNGDAHRSQRVLERLELRAQCGLDSISRFVAGPKFVAEGLDHVIGGDAYVCGALADHLQHGIEHAGNRPESPILSTGEAAQSIKMAEELVGTVDQMNDHAERFRAALSGTLPLFN